MAQRFHSSFIKRAPRYRRAEAYDALGRKDYPSFFQMCFDADSQLYRCILKDSFSPRRVKPVYRRFVDAIERIEGASIVTTNVDEMLERTLPDLELVQRSDISRTVDLISSRARFIAKVHGSISSIETTVFKSDDYRAVAADVRASLRYLLTACSVVFIGYSIRDKYLLDLLDQNAAQHSLFGDGPYFLVSSEPRPELPESINLIQYDTDFHTDHRSSILSLELASCATSETLSLGQGLARPAPSDLRSAHMLSDLYPAGTWTTGNTCGLEYAEGGRTAQLIVGPDWAVGEIPQYATAAHDLAMGLICFDQVLYRWSVPRGFSISSENPDSKPLSMMRSSSSFIGRDMIQCGWSLTILASDILPRKREMRVIRTKL